MAALTRPAPAKINLTLRIAGRRQDGFHELESLVAQANLCDTVTATAVEDGCYALDCDDPALPRDGSNLVLQAAKALNHAAGTNHGTHITLQKRIPVGAGLGGGSSDAATALLLLDDLWNTGRDPNALAALGATLGSDVPLFFSSPLCVLRGRGEHVEPLGTPPPLWAALVLPELYCSTAAVYAAWNASETTAKRPNLTEVLAARGSAADLMPLLFNDLETAAFRVVPQLGELAARIAAATGESVRLTGSGAALFRLFDDAQQAARFALVIGGEVGVRVDVVALRR